MLAFLVAARFADQIVSLQPYQFARDTTEIVEKPAVVDVPHGKGHVLLFANNPMWRAETSGSYFLVFNAILNFENLDAGETAHQTTSPSPKTGDANSGEE